MTGRLTGRAVLLLLLAGCASSQSGALDVATVGAGAFGAGQDVDLGAATVAANAFGDASRTYGRPAAGARAAAALEYMAGASLVTPRWQGVSAATKEQLLAARGELRRALAVRPDARSQQVVAGLLEAAAVLDGGGSDADAAAALDRSGAFTLPGAQELGTLSNLPYLRTANLATQHAADELQGNDTEFRHF